MKKQATVESCGKIMKRWYGIHALGYIATTWAETKEDATKKFRKSDAGLESVLPAPSANEEVRPLRKNMGKNIAMESI